MTREEAKDIVLNYALGQKINDGINTLDELINQIFNEHEAQIAQIKAEAEAEHDQRNSAMSQKESLLLLEQLKAKEEEIERLKQKYRERKQ